MNHQTPNIPSLVYLVAFFQISQVTDMITRSTINNKQTNSPASPNLIQPQTCSELTRKIGTKDERQGKNVSKTREGIRW